MHLQIATQLDMCHWLAGDSVAINGVCLTLTAIAIPNNIFSVTLSPETLAITTFATAQIGQAVNLEPALRMGDAIGGHWVLGHVDATATVLQRQPKGEHIELCFSLPPNIANFVVQKGSITIAGVSLTINQLIIDTNIDVSSDHRNNFYVNVIPHTLLHTNLSALSVGDIVNIESDMMARHVARLLESMKGKV